MKKFFIYTIFLSIVFSFQNVSAQKLSTELETQSVDVSLNQTFVVNLNVSANSNNPIFTVSGTAFYNPEQLELIDVQFAENTWFPLNIDPHYLTDTENGMIVRTAGYPGGLKSKTTFVKYTFKAIKEGPAEINLEQGRAYDDTSIDKGIQTRKLIINVGGEGENLAEEEGNIQIFDVNVGLSGDTAFFMQEPYTFKVYQLKYGQNLNGISNLNIYDKYFDLVYTSQKEFNASVDEIIEFTIPAFTLNEGNYTLEVTNVYSDGKTETVSRKEVGVLDNGDGLYEKYKQLLYIVLAALVFISVVHHLIIDRIILRRLALAKRKNSKNK